MKSLEALLRGYLLFRCDGRHYLTYAGARAAMAAMPKDADASFDGWHIVNGWRCFFLRMVSPPHVMPTIVGEDWQRPEQEWRASADL